MGKARSDVIIIISIVFFLLFLSTPAVVSTWLESYRGAVGDYVGFLTGSAVRDEPDEYIFIDDLKVPIYKPPRDLPPFLLQPPTTQPPVQEPLLPRLTVTLVSPPTYTVVAPGAAVDLVSTATPISNAELTTATLYHTLDNIWMARATILLNDTNTTTTNRTNFTLSDLPEGEFMWNVEYCDSSLACAFATENFYVVVGTPSLGEACTLLTADWEERTGHAGKDIALLITGEHCYGRTATITIYRKVSFLNFQVAEIKTIIPEDTGTLRLLWKPPKFLKKSENILDLFLRDKKENRYYFEASLDPLGETS